MNDLAAPIEQPTLSVTLRVDENMQRTFSRHLGMVGVARAYTIDSQEMADEASLERLTIKGALKALGEAYDGFVQPARVIIGNAHKFFKGPMDALAEADDILGQKLVAWTEEQEQIAAKAKREREEAERAARQKAEAEAAAEIAAAKQRAEEARRQAAEAERARAELAAAGKPKQAETAAADAARLREEARHHLEQGEAKAQAAHLEAQASLDINTPVVEPSKTKGFSTRDNWKAQLKDGVDHNAAVRLLCEAIVANRIELIALLKIDYQAADQMAKALKESFNVPGLEAFNKVVAVSRAR